METAEAFIGRKKAELLRRPVYAKDIGRAGRFIWTREAVTFMPRPTTTRRCSWSNAYA